ncbi:putative sterigmatocystin biosynthesis monooxygenase STCB [Cyphellophora attinorum]|uniref:Putative sterigmatocystin biosynthesis monooxygenase STCB n=1 Tax=Cyphellophora attinorum TaxID=1664694 RepID=A0A0N1NVM3_9EURO|nr:putative sterigmatocystin biosynthesis monooxygenase STCB [Phialophora attinorum]KPI35283.1 putative sterigmatocystin biosynthesis monooxygenase STCB [Phialophora attinorum]
MLINTSTARLAGTAGIFLLAAFLLRKIWLLLTDPLMSLPGPWHAKLTGVVLKIQTMMGNRCFYIHDLHQKYGSVVLIAPGEVDISDLEGFREIHRIASGFQKTDWYTKFTPGLESNVFGLVDLQEHAARRKLLARGFSNSSLQANFQSVVRDRAKLAVSRIKEEAATGNDCDILKWWTLMALDVTAQVAFGKRSTMLEAGKKTEYTENVSLMVEATGIRAEGHFFYNLIKLFSPSTHARYETSVKSVPSYGLQAVRETLSTKLETYNLISGMVKESAEADSKVSEFDLASQATAIIIAGSDTTATTLTYAVWAVLSRPEVRRELVREVSQLPEDYSQGDLEALSYLNAVLTETLRLYGAGPGSLPRVHRSKALTVGRYVIPPGVTLTTQAWTIHRDPTIFPEPEKFDPGRFVKHGLQGQQKVAFHPFGAGTRICLGLHLAYMELRYGLAEFFRECPGIELAASTTPESMAMVNYFLVSPKSKQCMVTSTCR